MIERAPLYWDDAWTDLLACPACGGPLVNGADAEFVCSGCGRGFPVYSRVPALLLDQTGAEQKTQELYGDIWSSYKPGRKTRGYDAAATSHMELLELASGGKLIKGLTGIDAGCGDGRSVLAMADRHPGVRFIGIDLTGSARETAVQARSADNVRFVQGNLMEPPLAKSAFDFAFSFGVLHHTRDPHAAFHGLLQRLHPGGRITIFVYKDFSDLPLKRLLLAPVTLTRRVSTRLPAPWLRRLARFASPIVFALLTLPARLLRSLRMGSLAQHIPYGTFPGIQGIAASLEDRFGAPYEHRFSLSDLEQWVRDDGLLDARVVDCLPWGFSGLVLSACTPRSPMFPGD